LDNNANLAALGRLITACRAKGLRPVLFDLPLNLTIVGNGLDKPRSSIHSGCGALARSRGVTYLHLQPSLELPNTAFWDIHHLVKPGYTLWQSRLTSELVKLFPKATTL